MGDEPIKHSSHVNGWANVFETGRESLLAVSGQTADEIKTNISNILSGFGEGSRTAIEVHTNMLCGHVIVAEVSSGQIVYIDPQSDEMEADFVFDMGLIPDTAKILRLDDKQFTNLVSECVEQSGKAVMLCRALRVFAKRL